MNFQFRWKIQLFQHSVSYSIPHPWGSQAGERNDGFQLLLLRTRDCNNHACDLQCRMPTLTQPINLLVMCWNLLAHATILGSINHTWSSAAAIFNSCLIILLFHDSIESSKTTTLNGPFPKNLRPTRSWWQIELSNRTLVVVASIASQVDFC